jgi:hypothetical protein
MSASQPPSLAEFEHGFCAFDVRPQPLVLLFLIGQGGPRLNPRILGRMSLLLLIFSPRPQPRDLFVRLFDLGAEFVTLSHQAWQTVDLSL